nr:CBASS oligonucleotide cyclase [Providencia sp. M-27]
MPLSNTELRYYDSNILRLPSEKRTEYHAQVDRLITELKKSVKDQNEIKITRVVKAGSFAKFTILRKTHEDPVDVDIVFYISDKDANQETLSSLSEKIFNALVKLYPNKSVEDFQLQRKAATVTFIKSGLNVDVVPVIEDTDKVGYGWQFDIHEGTKLHTCAPCQIQFIRDRKNTDNDFRTLVRLAKNGEIMLVWHTWNHLLLNLSWPTYLIKMEKKEVSKAASENFSFILPSQGWKRKFISLKMGMIFLTFQIPL